ncbi:unnamed protein product [Ilex paraguariensis]|uniref:Uncharacterized protein n=1 Tax=Ilex paraguariensis TaxID=185542 RepID=A0ABC8RSF1_9AQUA
MTHHSDWIKQVLKREMMESLTDKPRIQNDPSFRLDQGSTEDGNNGVSDHQINKFEPTHHSDLNMKVVEQKRPPSSTFLEVTGLNFIRLYLSWELNVQYTYIDFGWMISNVKRKSSHT